MICGFVIVRVAALRIFVSSSIVFSWKPTYLCYVVAHVKVSAMAKFFLAAGRGA
jgi:hypothetical protein